MTRPVQAPDPAQSGRARQARDTANQTVTDRQRALLSQHGDHSAHGQGRIDADGDFDNDVVTRGPGGGVTLTKNGNGS